MDDTIVMAMVTGGIGLLGALIGGAATFFGTWWASREERRTRREELKINFRIDLAKRHEEREVGEYGHYKDFLDRVRHLEALVLTRVRTGVEPQKEDREAMRFVYAPSLIFAPPDVAADLNAAREEFRDTLLRISAEAQRLKGPQPEIARKAEEEFAAQRSRVSATLKQWAGRLRSGAAALDHTVLTDVASTRRLLDDDPQARDAS